MSYSRSPIRGGALAAAVLLIGVLSVTAAQAAPKEDPFEHANRRGYASHQFFDRVFLRPLARTYQSLVPGFVRAGIRHVISNMEEPGVVVNDLLQAHPVRATKTLTRFVANSTVGLGGLVDVAKHAGLPHHDNGFADTLGRYGVPAGPYLFAPLIGPSTVRDLIGTVADVATDPFTWARFQQRTEVIATRTVVGGLDERAENDSQLKAIDQMSTDPYASLRSFYLQNREAEIADVTTGGAAPEPVLPDFDSTEPPAAAPDAPPVPTAPPASTASTPAAEPNA